MKRRTALILGLGLVLVLGLLSLPYAAWRFVCWLLFDPKGDD